MKRIIALLATSATAVLGVAAWIVASAPWSAEAETHNKTGPTATPSEFSNFPTSESGLVLRPAGPAPIVIPECRLVAVETQEVPVQHDGQLLFVGTDLDPKEPTLPDRESFREKVGFVGFELQPEDTAPENQIVTVSVMGQVKRYRALRTDDPLDPAKIWIGTLTKHFRLLRENDRVRKGQLLALLDASRAIDDLGMKHARLAAAQADFQAAQATRIEGEQRLETARTLLNLRATSAEEFRAAQLNADRNRFDEASKRQAIELAKREMNQAWTILAQHEIRSKIDGVIYRSIHKKPGEAVKKLEPAFHLENPARLRVEGKVEAQYLRCLQTLKDKGEMLVVKRAHLTPPRQQLTGHLLEVTSVAVSTTPQPAVVSASEDGTVRVWDLRTSRERWIWRHSAPVRAVACTSPEAKANLCISGTADGSAWLWDLESGKQVRELAERHSGPINCLAFSPDGTWCATGGDDHSIRLWETATGALRACFPSRHRGRITSLQFTRDSRLLSVSSDNTMLLWKIGPGNVHLDPIRFDRRSGDVAVLGIDSDGSRLLFDMGQELRVLSLPTGQTEGVLSNHDPAVHFTTMALFAPRGDLIVTSASDGHLLLWTAPTLGTRAHALRRFVGKTPVAATCGAFAADGSFLVTGMKDRQVLVWPLPSAVEVSERLRAKITLVESHRDEKWGRSRIWAEIDNRNTALIPGERVLLVAYPD